MRQQILTLLLCVALVLTGIARVQPASCGSACGASASGQCCCTKAKKRSCCEQAPRICHCADHDRRAPDAPSPTPPRLPDLAPVEHATPLLSANDDEPRAFPRALTAAPRATPKRALNLLLRTFLI